MILADSQIKGLCSATHLVAVHHPQGGVVATVPVSGNDAELTQHVARVFKQFNPEANPAYNISALAPQHFRCTLEEYKNPPRMISPFVPEQVRRVEDRRIMSYGLSSYGYDVRLADTFKIFTNLNSTVIDPLSFDDEQNLVEFKGDHCIIPPNSYLLGHTPEVFDIPEDIMVICLGKSSYARCGAIVNVTPVEPGFKGQVVIEISNATPLPMKVYAGMGIAQFLFLKGDVPCDISYAKGDRKYQGQFGVVTPRV